MVQCESETEVLKADADWKRAVLGFAESALLADFAEPPAGTDEPP